MTQPVRLQKYYNQKTGLDVYLVTLNGKSIGSVIKYESYIWEISGYHVSLMTGSFKTRKAAVKALIESFNNK